MSKKIDALEFVNETIEGINEYEKMTGKRPAAYIYLDILVEIQQALLKGQEFKDENRILLENISDLEDQNALYAKNLYNCEDILNIIKEKNVNLEVLGISNDVNCYNKVIVRYSVFYKELTEEEFELVKRYLNDTI